MTPSDVKATLSFSDGSPSMELPIYKGTIGPDVIDIRKLYGQTGKFTYDPGFLSTASCNSTITYIDGDKGELLYRGYPIEQQHRSEGRAFGLHDRLILKRWHSRTISTIKNHLDQVINHPSGVVARRAHVQNHGHE